MKRRDLITLLPGRRGGVVSRGGRGSGRYQTRGLIVVSRYRCAVAISLLARVLGRAWIEPRKVSNHPRDRGCCLA